MSEVMSVSNHFPAPSETFVQVINKPVDFPNQIVVKGQVPLNVFQLGIKIGDIFITRVDGLEKATKNSQRLLELGKTLKILTSEPLQALSKTLKNAIDVFDVIKLVGIVNLFFTPQKNGQYFLFNDERSSFKKIDRTFLACHLGCKTARILNKWKLIDLGKIASAKIGKHFTVFHLVTESLMSLSALFNILDVSKKIQAYPTTKSQLVRKLKKWKENNEFSNLLSENNLNIIVQFREKSLNKLKVNLNKIEQAQKRFTLYPLKAHQIKLLKLQKSVKKLETRLTYVDKGDYKSIVEDLSKSDAPEKIQKIYFNQEVHEAQHKINIVKIALSISKIFVITLAFAINAFNFTTLFPVMALLACGFISDSFGLAKVALETLLNEKKVDHLMLQEVYT